MINTILSINEFDLETRLKAEKLLLEIQKNSDLNWGAKLSIFDNMKIFHKCEDHIGLPKNEFLKRLSNIRPFIKQSKHVEPFEDMLNVSFNKLNNKIFGKDNIELRVKELHKIMSIVAVTDFNKNGLIWFENNGELVGMSLLQNLCHSNMYLVTETCYVSSYIIRFIQTNIPFVTCQAIIKGCIDAISMRVLNKENYIDNYREERLKHEDLELFAGKELPFHWPKFDNKGKSREYCAISCSIYTLAFLFQFNPYPKLILAFQNQIFCRRELVRNILFKLYIVILKYIDKTLTDFNKLWKKLPFKLYGELSKALTEKNLANKKLVLEIVHILQELSNMKLPSLSMNIYQNNDHFKVTIPDNKTSVEKIGISKTSVRLVLKGNAAKLEKDITDNTTETSLTEEFDDQFRESLLYQRKSMLSQEFISNIQTND